MTAGPIVRLWPLAVTRLPLQSGEDEILKLIDQRMKAKWHV